MNPYYEKLKTCFEVNPRDLIHDDVDSICDLLYRFYMDTRVEDPEIIRDQYKAIHDLVSHMPLRQQDAVWDSVCIISTEYGRAAFCNGMQLGARLMLELSA